jgi:hypothetical protein
VKTLFPRENLADSAAWARRCPAKARAGEGRFSAEVGPAGRHFARLIGDFFMLRHLQGAMKDFLREP